MSGALLRWGSAALLFAPGVALACATCVDPKEASRGAFIGVTMFLSLLPLGLMAAIGGYIWYRVRERDAALAAESPAPLPFPSPAVAESPS